MSQSEEDQLHQFFTKFNIAELGMGDPVTGANTLAAMCGVLAGVSRTGSCIVAENGRLVRIGTNFLVYGAASVGLVVDEVVTELGLRQNNFSENLRHDLIWRERMSKKNIKSWVPTPPESSNSESQLHALLNSKVPAYCPLEKTWSEVLAGSPNDGAEHLAARPKFFVTAARPKDLEKQLTGLRRGQVLVHLGIHRASDLTEFGGAMGALLDGCQEIGNGGESVGGTVLITDPMELLGEAAKTPDEGTAWLGRTVWLCDAGTGPEIPAPVATKGSTPASSLTARFQVALGLGLGKRLCGDRVHPEMVEAEFMKSQRRWTAFLRDMERSLPGISGAARNLPATLLFGLRELSHAPCRSGKLQLKVQDAEVFARFLVRRMAVARTTILYAAEVARRQWQIRRIFQKLHTLPVDVRTIYKSLNIASSDCYDCLKWLETASLARCVDSRWERVEGAQLNFSAHPLPVLDV